MINHSTQHTPAPWGATPMVKGADSAFYIVGNREGNNAEVEVATVGPSLSPRTKANAALIATSPELLLALENAIALIGHRMPMDANALVAGEKLVARDVWNAGCAAIAKARGQT